MLTSRSVSGVLHSSACRHNAPRCSEGDHEPVRKKIMHLIREDTGSVSTLLWIYGHSHISAIAQSTADNCSRLGISPVTFFFSRETSDHNTFGIKTLFSRIVYALGLRDYDPQYSAFIPTIACQLCIHTPQVRANVSKAVEDNPFLLTQNPTAQVSQLIVGPFTYLLNQSEPCTPLPCRPIIIIDAPHILKKSQHISVCQAILDLVDQFPYPITIVVFSKPSSQIRKVFRSYNGMANIKEDQIPTIHRHLSDVDPLSKVVNHIKRYLGIWY